MNSAENQIIRLTLQAKLDYLPGATALVREVTGKLGLSDRDTRRMELVVEEACVNVIEHAFEGETGSFDIVVSRRPGQVVIAVEDSGLPIDFKKFEEGGETGLGTVLMKAFADEVHFMNLGRQGKRVELVKDLPEANVQTQLQELAAKPAAAPFAESEIKVRLMRPEESTSLSRCAYRCYGYTYVNDILYFPERVKELVAGGMMISVVAVDPQGEIVGHVSVNKENPQALIGESGQAIVDPRYRGVGFHKQIGFLLGQINKDAGMVGTYGEAVTVHPYSQKSALTRGYVEMGILLGYTPPTMQFKSIQGQSAGKRSPVLLLYKRLNDGPPRDIYLPTYHAGVLRRIYERSGLSRNFLNSVSSIELPVERSQVNIKVQTDASRAFMRVVEYGRDLEDVIRFRLKELCTRKVDLIFLDLPLTHPALQRYCAAMEMLGFFFGGVLPEMPEGDVLRLQYVNNAELELQSVQLASDFARELFQYVLKAGGIQAGNAENR